MTAKRLACVVIESAYVWSSTWQAPLSGCSSLRFLPWILRQNPLSHLHFEDHRYSMIYYYLHPLASMFLALSRHTISASPASFTCESTVMINSSVNEFRTCLHVRSHDCSQWYSQSHCCFLSCVLHTHHWSYIPWSLIWIIRGNSCSLTWMPSISSGVLSSDHRHLNTHNLNHKNVYWINRSCIRSLQYLQRHH